MRMAIRGLAGLVLVVGGWTPAHAQVVGTFAWQTQPYCNIVTLTVVQQGPQYQVIGHDNLCGAGTAPVIGTAAPSSGGVQFGFTITRPDGRAAHLSADISLVTLSGTWTDDDARTGTFAFGGVGAGAERPAPAVARQPGVTVLTYTGITTSGGGTITPAVKLRDLATFTSRGGALRVYWHSHLATMPSGGFGGCNMQVRIDGQASGPLDAAGLTGDEAVLIAGASKADAPATSTAWFTGVPAGQHTIELWVRSVTAGCTDNAGGFRRRVIVEEFGAP